MNEYTVTTLIDDKEFEYPAKAVSKIKAISNTIAKYELKDIQRIKAVLIN